MEKEKPFKDECKICGQKFEAYTEGQLKNMIKKHEESNKHIINKVRDKKK